MNVIGQKKPQLIETHNAEIHKNRMRWNQKPLLRKIYKQFYEVIAKEITRQVPGKHLELGSGVGAIKEVIPDCITSDLFPNEWLDCVENAYALSFVDESISNIILFDVWHHLEYPGAALNELNRVLTPGGRLILFEPAMGILGRLIYGLFHHEPTGLNRAINWEPIRSSGLEERYYAAQGNAWRIFHSGEGKNRLAGWKILSVRYLSAIAYIGTGGFRGPHLYPGFLFGMITYCDLGLSLFPSLFATRMLVVLEKT